MGIPAVDLLQITTDRHRSVRLLSGALILVRLVQVPLMLRSSLESGCRSKRRQAGRSLGRLPRMQDPAANLFVRQSQLFYREVLVKKYNIVDYWDRYEFQGRRSTHNYGLYWFKDASHLDLTTETPCGEFAEAWGGHVSDPRACEYWLERA